MSHRIDFLWCLEAGGTRYRVAATYQGDTVTTTVDTESVKDQRVRQEVEQRLADRLQTDLALPANNLGPLI
jgi:hypothetical protein